MINLNIDYNKYNLLKEKGIIEEINNPEMRKYTFFLNINKVRIFFKEEEKENIVNELIIDNICKLFNKDILEQNYGYITNKNGKKVYGLISKDYKIKNYNYIPLDTILNDYYAYITNNNINYENIRIYEMINLETIYQALDHRYKKYPNYEEKIKKVMEELVNRFLIDILTGQSDRHGFNIEIKETETDFSLSCIYDNTESLKYDKFDMGVTMNSLVFKNDYMLDLLNEFLNISEYKYVEIFNNMLNILTIDKFINIVNEIKIKTEQLELPEKYFNLIIENYTKYYKEYKKIISKRLR